MNGIQLALNTLRDGEQHLATELVTVADRHRSDQILSPRVLSSL